MVRQMPCRTPLGRTGEPEGVEDLVTVGISAASVSAVVHLGSLDEVAFPSTRRAFTGC